MNSISNLSFRFDANVYGGRNGLSMLFVNVRPAVFASSAHEAHSAKVHVHSHRRVVGLMMRVSYPSSRQAQHATRESHACPTFRKAAAAIRNGAVEGRRA